MSDINVAIEVFDDGADGPLHTVKFSGHAIAQSPRPGWIRVIPYGYIDVPAECVTT